MPESNNHTLASREAPTVRELDEVLDAHSEWLTKDVTGERYVGLVKAFKAKLAGYRIPGAAEGWMPIETAPKDGTPFLGAVAEANKEWMCVAMWSDPVQQWRNPAGYTTYLKLSNWMPLPAPPTGAAEGTKDDGGQPK